MSAKRRRPRKVTNVVSLCVAWASVEINGERVGERRSVDYERTEYSDGTCDERGLPAGMKPKPSVQQLIEYTLGGGT